ncbi:gluconolactonase [Sorangium cellulosum]|uniref:Gluconolactonase n=1 Tax=Sorangium cellulosum TaxID=56 RepID=A0A2L0F1U7_SORCE|nr:SMP-30/gluconolactonase/LRE family protein [Sorangium cellulosum]AUX45534.1 gluconolactonase [Sorangium cellulosum]
MKRGHRLLGWALLLSSAPSACGDAGGASGGAGAGGGTTSVSSGGGAGGEGEAGGGEAAGGGGGDVQVERCPGLQTGIVEPTLVTDVFSGSEDFAFNGQGYIVAKQGSNLIRYASTGQTSNFAYLPGDVRGLRYRPDGTLVAAQPSQGAVVQISTSGIVSDYVGGLLEPNGLSPDADGNVWATERAGDRVIRLNPDASVDVIASGAPEVSQPKGIVFDPGRRVVFYTNSSGGEIRRIDVAAPGEPPALVSAVEGTALEGLALDTCGHLYAVDGGGARLYRVQLDAGGDAAAEPELLANFPTRVTNAQFGSGPGFNAKTLYVGGAQGAIYAVRAGINGAPVPTPPRAP